MPTFTLISATTVGAGNPQSVTLSSIPQTYTDLLLKISARTSRTGTWEGGLGLAINGNSSTGYFWKMIEGSSGNISSSTTPYEATWVNRINAANSSTSTFSSTEIYLGNYTNAYMKSYNADGVAPNNLTNYGLTMLAGSQSSTSAITSLQIRDESGFGFVQNTTIYLYGISNA